MLNKHHIFCYKTIMQISFPFNLRYLHGASDVAADLEGFTSWKIATGRVACQDFEGRSSLVIEPNRVGWSQDRTPHVEAVDSRRTQQINQVVKGLMIENFNRFGARKKYYVNVGAIGMDFENLVTIFDLKFNSQDDELRSFLPAVSDGIFRVDGEDEDFTYHIHVAPVKEDQIEAAMDFNSELHMEDENKVEDYYQVFSAFPKVSLYIDIDVYKSSKEADMDLDQIKVLEVQAEKKLAELSRKFVEYTFS